MYIRWLSRERLTAAFGPLGKRDAHWRGILVETVQVRGKSEQRHISYLVGFTESALAIPQQQRFIWAQIHQRLDRLSRNLAFIATLTDSGVEFVATDNPHANKLTIHILAAVAEHECEAISERTKAALAAAKARGKKLGGPRLAAARQASIKARSEIADAFAANVRPIIKEIRASGVTSLHGIARALAARGVKTARGGEWSDVQVAAVLRR